MGISNEVLELRKSLVKNDRQLIGDLFQEIDEGKDFVSGDDNYVWFHLVASVIKPKFIAEMGSRFGYSLKCFVEGSGHSMDQYSLRSFDFECDGIETLKIMEDYFKNVMGIEDIVITKVDTQQLKSLDLDNQCDLCLVDGMHTTEGCYHECWLAWDALKSGGVMVVDDFHADILKEGLDKFCTESGAVYESINSFRGMAIIVKP